MKSAAIRLFWKTVRLMESQIPDITADDNIVIYQKNNASKSPDYWQREIFEEYQNKTALAGDVSSAQNKFILCFSFFETNELPSIHPAPDSLYVYSSSEPPDEEQEIGFLCLHRWLEYFSINAFGLPVDENDRWRIPEAEQGLHASGHACSAYLLKV